MGHRQAIHSSESTTRPASGCINNYVYFAPYAAPRFRFVVPYAHNDAAARAFLARVEARQAYDEQLRSRRDANRAIEDQLSEINQSIRDLPMRQYIWGD